MAALETARQNIVTAIEAAKTGAPTSNLVIEYDNRIVVNTQTQTDPYLAVHVMFMGGAQADLSDAPIHRVYGQIHLAAVVKEGQGSAKALALLDFFFPQLQRKTFGIVHTHMADTTPVKTLNGLVYYPILVPFWFDKIY